MEISWGLNKPISVITNKPREGAIDAFMNNYRFFCQNNEGSSFENIQNAYNSLPISLEKKKQFNNTRSNLNQYLDTSSTINIVINNKQLTRREIVDTLMYGMIVHSNEKKRNVVRQWSRDQILFSTIKIEFCAILTTLLNFILDVKILNNKVIQDLESFRS